MSKAKLTLYIDEEISKLAHKTAKLSGKSVSNMVQDYFRQKKTMASADNVSSSVSKWVGVLKIDKTYKELRDELVSEKLETYEGSD